MAFRRIFPLLLMALVALSACKSGQKARQGEPAAEMPGGGNSGKKNYRKMAKSNLLADKDSAAMHFYRRKQYDRAVFLLEELNGVYAGTPRGEEIYYYYAWCRYNLGELKSASFYFSDFSTRFPGNKHAQELAYMNARCLYQLADPYELDQTYTYKALDELQLFVSRYPKSEYAVKAGEMTRDLRERLAKKSFEQARLYYKIGYYKSAVEYFQLMIDEFPDSKLREEAFYLLSRSALLLADKSISDKKQERYEEAAAYAKKFAVKYPDSKFAKDAEALQAAAEKGRVRAEADDKERKEAQTFARFKAGMEAAATAVLPEDAKREYERAMGYYHDLERLNPSSEYLEEAEKVFRQFEKRTNTTVNPDTP